MALTVEIISKFREKFGEDFESFFAGLYEEEIAASIIGDLCQFVTNEYIERIIFGFLTEDGIIDPEVAYDINTKAESIAGLGKGKDIKSPEFSEDRRQRILILELAEKFTNLDRENTLDFLRNSLFNDWSYLVDLDMVAFPKRDIFFSKGPLTIQRGVKNGDV